MALQKFIKFCRISNTERRKIIQLLVKIKLRSLTVHKKDILVIKSKIQTEKWEKLTKIYH